MNWFRRFMSGRYGSDKLNTFCLVSALVFLVLQMFTRFLLFEAIGLAFLVICYIRMFSRNISARSRENQIFLGYWNKLRRKFSREKTIMSQRKEYHFYTCAKCKCKIRIPRGKGRIEITCPKCGNKFIKNS